MNRSIRNIVIFAFVSLTCGWLGVLADKFVEQQPEGDTLGMGLWLVLPLFAVILLRFFADDGWKDTGIRPDMKGNMKWYVVALLIFPLVTATVLAIGKMLGWIDFTNFRTEVFFTGFIVDKSLGNRRTHSDSCRQRVMDFADWRHYHDKFVCVCGPTITTIPNQK